MVVILNTIEPKTIVIIVFIPEKEDAEIVFLNCALCRIKFSIQNNRVFGRLL